MILLKIPKFRSLCHTQPLPISRLNNPVQLGYNKPWSLFAIHRYVPPSWMKLRNGSLHFQHILQTERGQLGRVKELTPTVALEILDLSCAITVQKVTWQSDSWWRAQPWNLLTTKLRLGVCAVPWGPEWQYPNATDAWDMDAGGKGAEETATENVARKDR